MVEPRRRFRFLKELSEGAFGKVYMAEMITGEGFSSIVAIKLLHGKWLGHQEIAQRSRDEARLLGLLHHRNIVRVEDLTSLNGQCAVVMEYLDGVDLKTLIGYCRDNDVRFPKRAAFEITAQIASALEAAYYQTPLQGGSPLHVIHRDIKPSNVMVTSAGDVKVLDFGTARANFEEREAKTQALAFGSQAYMAPERLLGDPDGPSGDIFSLGITLYEYLTFRAYGKIFIREERYDRALEERLELIDLSELDAATGEQVLATLRRMLAYSDETRPTAGECVELMEHLAEAVNDGSLQRFCRQVVKPCYESVQPKQNPTDPLTGSTLFEDTSTGFHTRPGYEDNLPPDGSELPEDSSELPEDNSDLPEPPLEPAPPEQPAWSPSEPAASAVPLGADLPSPSAPLSAASAAAPSTQSAPQSRSGGFPAGPAAEVSAPQSRSGARPAPSRAGAVPAWASEAPAAPPPEPAAPPTPAFNAAPPTWAADPEPAPQPPPRVNTVTPEQQGEEDAPAPAPQGKSKLLIVAVVGLLGALGLGGLVLSQLGGDKSPAPPTPPPKEAGTAAVAPPAAPAGPALPSGGRVEVGPLDGSSGTVKLSLASPGPVSISSATGFKQEWDGTGTLELVGLPAGNYRAKISPAGGSTVRTNLDVVAGQTCTFTYDGSKGEEWERVGCE